MNYASFTSETTDADIFDMMMEGLIKCLCYNCKKGLKIPADTEVFICPHCKQHQGSPMDDPNEFSKMESDEE